MFKVEKGMALLLFAKEYLGRNKQGKAWLLVICGFLSLGGLLLIFEGIFKEEKVIIVDKESDYKNSRLISGSIRSITKNKERHFDKKMNQIVEMQEDINNSLKSLRDKTTELEGKLEKKLNDQKDEQLSKLEEKDLRGPISNNSSGDNSVKSTQNVRMHGSNFDHRSDVITNSDQIRTGHSSRSKRRRQRRVISFPVKSTHVPREEGVVLPSGSYVKAKLMTGIEAPEGKTYPVLLQLDFAHILPNDRKLDLVGCFMIAKASGSLSTERVQMQAVKLSCVSKTGEMFERKVNGFTADGGDNSFGVIGSVNSKQDRVAAMAFLSSVVEGVGKAIQMAQTTQSSNAVGGGQSIVTGDQAKYIGAGGVGNAAGQVTQWYLKQAQNLLPTINVGSGRDVWIVMADKVSLPKNYFQETRSVNNDTVYSYFTNILY